MRELTPKQIVEELDKYIIGQDEAKKMVAVALRSRYRRRQIVSEIKEDIMPKNIIMIGPTGVGKTEIARRLARLVNAPFIKVEATKFTEVGYVGRDVDSIIRDLIEEAIRIVKEEKISECMDKASVFAHERIVELLSPYEKKKTNIKSPFEYLLGMPQEKEEGKEKEVFDSDIELKKEQIRKQLDVGLLDNTIVEIEVDDTSSSPMEMVAGGNIEEISINIQDMFGNLFPKKKKTKKVTVREAYEIFIQEEANKLLDMDEVYKEAKKRAEEDGIVFIDEIDKIASKGSSHGPDVSREGVQRDILPIVEGSTVNTKYGPIKTDYMLFIAAGAFQISKVTDLIPELQGRFPVHVELLSLTKDDFKGILTKPKNALIKQYKELLNVEGIELMFAQDGIDAIAEISYEMNSKDENIGARRLHTIIEKVLMDISFEAPDIENKIITIDRDYVCSKTRSFLKENDVNKFII